MHLSLYTGPYAFFLILLRKQTIIRPTRWKDLYYKDSLVFILYDLCMIIDTSGPALTVHHRVMYFDTTRMKSLAEVS